MSSRRSTGQTPDLRARSNCRQFSLKKGAGQNLAGAFIEIISVDYRCAAVCSTGLAGAGSAS